MMVKIVAALVCVPLLALSTATAKAPPAPFEPYAALQAQIKGHQVVKATIRPKRHIAHFTLRDGKKLRVQIPNGQQRALVASLRAEGAKVHVKKKKHAGHILRYVALAIVVVGLLVAMVYLVRRRSRRTTD
jgi:ATP-dependent Zn protease